MVLWVFGYGSLIWKPEFSYEESVVGYVKNYKRAFHQACIDFRGTPEEPGRSLTLVEQEGAVTWGVAYRVTASVEAQMVQDYLNQRERTYDVRAALDIYTADCALTPAVSDALTYIATPGNFWYLGPATLQDMAEQIATRRGPAGANYEYLFRLEESLRQIHPACVDKETIDLVNEVRKILGAPKTVKQIGAGCTEQANADLTLVTYKIPNFDNGVLEMSDSSLALRLLPEHSSSQATKVRQRRVFKSSSYHESGDLRQSRGVFKSSSYHESGALDVIVFFCLVEILSLLLLLCKRYFRNFHILYCIAHLAVTSRNGPNVYPSQDGAPEAIVNLLLTSI